MKKTLTIASLGAVCLSLAACTSPSRPTGPAVEGLNVQGELTYLQRIALSPNSIARFSVYEVPPADASAKEVWHHDMSLEGKQVPIPFAFSVDKTQLPVNQRYGLRAVIHDETGTMRWTSDAFIPIDAQGDVADVGQIKMVQVAAPQGTASGVFRATGNEPGWNFTLQNNQADVTLDYGQTRYNMTLPPPQTTYAGTHYRGTYNGADFAIDMVRTPCFDNMSGESFDHEVALTIDNRLYKGCGRYQ